MKKRLHKITLLVQAEVEKLNAQVRIVKYGSLFLSVNIFFFFPYILSLRLLIASQLLLSVSLSFFLYTSVRKHCTPVDMHWR